MLRVTLSCTIVLLLASCQSVTPRTWELPPQVKTLRVNGYEMAYLERGTGVPLVLVHGGLSDYRYWAPQIEPFSRQFRTISVSLRHYYPERWNGRGGDFSLRQHADDLAEFIKALNAGPVHLLGHSRGANVALQVVKIHPELLRSLVLADPSQMDDLMPNTPEARAASSQRLAVVGTAIARYRHKDIDGGLETFINEVGGPGTWARTPDAQRQIWRDNAWAISSLEQDYKEPFNCADAGKIELPVLALTGERSPDLYGLMHAALQRCVRQYTKVTIPGAPHIMNRVNPQAFNAAVLDFLSKH